MNVPFGDTSEHLINEVKIGRRYVTLFFADGEQLKIDSNVYTDYYLFAGKKLNNEQIKEMEAASKSAQSLRYVYNLFSHGEYTQEEVRQRLKKRGLIDEEIEPLIKRLLSSGLINDQRYAHEYVETALIHGYGPLRINKQLKEKGISTAIITNLKQEMISTDARLQEIAMKLAAKGKFGNEQMRKAKLYPALLHLGYSSEAVYAVLSSLPPLSISERKENLCRDLSHLEKKWSRKLTGKEYRERIIQSLRQKGYNYEDINEVLEDE